MNQARSTWWSGGSWASGATTVLVGARLMEVRGELQRESGVTHVIARELLDRTALIGSLRLAVHEFH